MSEGTAQRRAGLSQGRECRGRGHAPFARSPAAGCRQQALLQSERNIHRTEIKITDEFKTRRPANEKSPGFLRATTPVIYRDIAPLSE